MRRAVVTSLLWLQLAGYIAANTCTSTNEENVLQTGHDYTYNFKSEVFAEAVGTTDEKSKISLECQAVISHFQDNFYHLHLRECVVEAAGEPTSDSPGSAWIKDLTLAEISKHSVKFQLENGAITEVYTNPNDPLHFVNIKRGVLSAFVFKLCYTTNKAHEPHTDIHGTCPLTSIPLEGGTVQTSKDMLHCAFPSRYDAQYSPWSMFWNMSFIQYVINSTTDCEYRIHLAEKRIDQVFCKERHAIMLESSHRTAVAVQSNIRYSLKFVKSTRQTEKPVIPELTRKTDIRFEYERSADPESSPEDFLNRAEKMLSDLVLDSADEIRLFTIPQFTDFVDLLRTSHSLIPLVEQVQTCSYLPDTLSCSEDLKDIGKSYFNDAIVQCNSVPCMEAIAYMAKKGYFGTAYLNFIFYSYSNMHISKPEFLKHFKTICLETDSSLCWMSLGTLIRRTSSKHPDFKDKAFPELQEIALHFQNKIDAIFESKATTENYQDILKYIKAVGNMGDIYLQLVPEGYLTLIAQAKKSDTPEFVKVSIFEALKKFNYESAYETLLSVLADETVSTILRTLVYEQVIELSKDYARLEDEIMKILKHSENSQLKSYIASSIDSSLNHPDLLSRGKKKFIASIDHALKTNDVSLDGLILPRVGSTSSVNGLFSQFSFLPEKLKGFGFKKSQSTVFQMLDVFPRYFRNEYLMKAFSEIKNVIEVGGYSEGLQNVAILLHKILSEANFSPIAQEKMLNGIQAIMDEFQGDTKPSAKYNFDDNVVTNIEQLDALFREYSPKLKPIFSSYVDLFGSTLSYLSSGDLPSIVSHIPTIQNVLALLRHGVVTNTTRVVRLIEAYHSVPTMMGLPLHWTTNATLAFSLRGALKLDTSNFELHSDGFFQPSAALTFLNRMVVDFPTITQIGVQANSSAYTATHLKAKLEYTKTKKVFSIEKPTKSEKILELFRTNQLLRHNSAIDIPDWDIQRLTSAWCSSDQHSSTLGLQLCLDKSYPLVTHRLKPWALMSGSCRWQLVANVFDEKLKSYDFEIVKLPNIKSKELNLRFSTPGSDTNREITFHSETDPSKEDLKWELKIAAMPDWRLWFTKNQVSVNNKEIGERNLLTFRLSEDFQYQLTYSDKIAHEDHAEISAIENRSPTNKKISIVSEEQLISLNTPLNKYSWKKEVFKNGEHVNANMHLFHENLKSEGKWLHRILPNEFWESKSKAWMRLEMNWKSSIEVKDATNRRAIGFLKVPLSTIEFSADALEVSGREKMTLNLTKTETADNKLLAFVNLTYDLWTRRISDTNAKEILQFNVTTSRKSYAVQVHKIQQGSKFKFNIALSKALMLFKDGRQSHYVGWCDPEVIRDVELQYDEAKLSVETENKMIEKEDLLSRYSTLKSEDIDGLSNVLTTTKIAAIFPIRNETQSVTYDGYIIFSRGETILRFQKNFVMDSSYHNLELVSHTVFKGEKGLNELEHDSYFTNTLTHAKAFNNIHYRTFLAEKCLQAEFQHIIQSPLFDLTTYAEYKCNTNGADLHTFVLKMHTNSSEYNMLDTELNQIIEEISNEYSHENVNFSHPALTINVTADWVGKMKDHTKNVTLTCLMADSCQNAKLFIKASSDGKATAKLVIPDNGNQEFFIERRISTDSKNLKLKMKYSDDKDKFEDLELSGEIMNVNDHVWKAKFNTYTVAKLKSVISDFLQSIQRRVSSAAKDPNHPVNSMLKSVLQGTLFQYWKGVYMQGLTFTISTWINIQDTLKSLWPIYELPISILQKSVYSAAEVSRNIYQSIKEKSVTIWAIEYFQLPHYIYVGLTKFDQGISWFMQLLQPEDRNLRVKFKTGNVLEMESFREWPKISKEWMKMEAPTVEKITPHHQSRENSKMAMIFGPLHVYTFDGVLYESAEYSSPDCLFLLAHDLHKSMFSVLSSKTDVHVLFPEMTVTINDKNEVLINGSRSTLPLQSSNGKVVVKKDNAIEIWSPSLKVTCRGRDFICIFEMSDWHSGGTFGLLGNADGSSNHILPNGKIASNIPEFVGSYEVSGKPECRSFKISYKAPSPSEDDGFCKESLSHLCSQRKDIKESFLNACKSYGQKQQDACYAITGYSALCYWQQLSSGVHCNGIKQESRKIGHKLEVVLIVHEHYTLNVPEKKNAPHKGIERLLTAVNEKFKADGYSSITYSLIGYGGKGAHYQPAVHSSGNVWVPLRELVNDLLPTLVFEGDDEIDNLSGLQFASETLGFDTFNSKIFIMLTPNDKQTKNKKTINIIQDQLANNGITLYTISSYPSIEKGKKVFGVRADGLIFPSPKKDGTAFLDYPKGDLAKLTAATRGSVFLSKFVLNNNPASFYGEFAEEVWAKVHKEVQNCRNCRAVKGGWWWKLNECPIAEC